MRLTILFDPPYWVGLLEDERDGYLYAARHIFGAEPSDQEVYAFIQTDFVRLCQQMTVGVPISETAAPRHINPKRRQREVRRELSQLGIATKAQEALRLQLEHHKHERQQENREEREAQQTYKRALAREKAKARHKGH
ncbi:MAG TPA: YjdF family protein [Phototrophicaceae bacterium]|nr:YjdF family protein [Phototrophicaceae bacterium]